MFRIFKKEKPRIIVVDEPKTKINNIITNTVKNYPKEVLEIHHEFETAAEKLLEEANNIINSQPVVNESKINVLKSLGFKQVKEVQESTEILAKTKMSKEQIEFVNYYQQNYPFNKFITEEQVKTICHKYNLVCGDVDRFKGFVPEKNVNEIANFKLKDKDCIKEYTFGDNFMTEENLKRNSWWDELHERLVKEGNSSTNRRKCRNITSSLQICAPVKDMDISGLELKEGYKLEKKHIPDPVVLQPVKGGYLILTAWGDEASDPLVVNQNFN